jgi:hypothetical protein
VTFNPNGGSGSLASQSSSSATTLTLNANAITRLGYAFGGWASTPTGGLWYRDGARYWFSTGTTLYALWLGVVFESNGGSGTMAGQGASTSTPLSANAFTRSGYTFRNWSTDRSGGGGIYEDKATYLFDRSLTLYAIWDKSATVIQEKSATVTFDANGGSGSIASQSASKSTALTLNAGAITRSGYTFGGWNTSANGNGTAYANGASYPFTASATSYILFATWGCLPLTVTVSAKRVGANKSEVYFTAPQSESPWTSFAAYAAKEGGKGATLPTALNTGTITVTSLDKNSGYTFDVTATNAAGCSYKATANRITKW